MKRTMKNILSFIAVLALISAAFGVFTPAESAVKTAADFPAPPAFSRQTAANVLFGKTVVGYQAWFGNNWYHPWRTFEIWPSVGDYPAESLWNSRFNDLGNGQKAQLFNSTDPGVIETHFRWMEECGIDCAAIQRFYGYTLNGGAKDHNRFGYLKTIMQRAQAHDRSFYIMYDMSGATQSASTVVPQLQNDFINNIEGQGLVSSKAYAHADGKPVVCIWGLQSNSDNYPGFETAYQLVTWFRDRGYYVIIGTPDNLFYRDATDYARVYEASDMISPWYVGRYGPYGLGTLTNMLRTDKNWCDEHGKAFLPVLFPGSAWANMQRNGKYNENPRLAGDFLWKQGIRAALMGCDTVYFAMFDEYDEGTAIMKAATDASMIPAGENDYYLTLAADGCWLSDDFYMRMASKVGEFLRSAAAGEVDPSDTDVYLDLISVPPIFYSEGPVYYRNGFTYKYVNLRRGGTDDDPVYERTALRIDPGVADKPASFDRPGSGLITLTEYDRAVRGQDGNWTYTFAGVSEASEGAKGTVHRLLSRTYFKLAKDTVLTYTLKANNAGGEKVFVNLMLEGNRLLSQEMTQVKATGAKAGQTVTVTVPVSNDLRDKIVTGIYISCETDQAEEFSATIDDMLIEIGGEGVGAFTCIPEPAAYITGDADGDEQVTSTDARLTLQLAVNKISETDVKDPAVLDIDGDGSVTSTDARLILQKSVGKIKDWP